MREASLRVVPRPDGKHEVRTVAGDVLAVCDSNAKAWRWIDRHSVEGQNAEDRAIRIRQTDRLS